MRALSNMICGKNGKEDITREKKEIVCEKIGRGECVMDYSILKGLFNLPKLHHIISSALGYFLLTLGRHFTTDMAHL